MSGVALGLPTADDYVRGHGDRSYAVRHYDLDLSYAVADNRLRGEATLDVEVLEPTDRLVLDLAWLDVAKVRVSGAGLRRHRTRGHRLVLQLDDEAPVGARLQVTVRYGGRPRPLDQRHLGDAGWEELTDGVIVAGQPHGAPTWFPCNDRPDDKATYDLAITTQPDYHVVANGLLVDRRRHAGSVTWRYRMDRPMATYLATVQIGRYRVVEQAAEPPVATVAPDGVDLTGSFDQQGAMMAAFERLFGPYPFDAYSAVVTADDLEIPLESQGLSTFGANFCSAEWERVRLVAHELAHQWFGNAVTLGRWRDIWLHEGFACYAEWLWSEESDGPRTAAEWARHHHERLADLDQDLLLSDPGPDLMFDDRVYKRGALTLHALRVEVGDEAFFDVLRSWVAEHADGSVSTAQFLAHASDRTGHDVDALLEPWLAQTALPPFPE